MVRADRNKQQAGDTAAYFDGEAAGWSGRYLGSRHFRARLETVLGWLVKMSSPGLSILDYGCGSGVLLRELSARGFQVTGVDVSEGMLDQARRNLADAGSVRLERVGPDFLGAYLGAAYDVITSLGVLEYLDDPWRLLEMLADVLKPGGSLIISVPNRASLLRFAERIVFRNPGSFRAIRLFPHLTGPQSYLNFQRYQFTVAELNRFMHGRSLHVDRVRYHVAPGGLGALEGWSAVGMTAIICYRKSPVDRRGSGDFLG
jgi:SAM-dependent methyltransferase